MSLVCNMSRQACESGQITKGECYTETVLADMVKALSFVNLIDLLIDNLYLGLSPSLSSFSNFLLIVQLLQLPYIKKEPLSFTATQTWLQSLAKTS